MAYTKEQKSSFKIWLQGSILVGAFGILTAWLIFPLAWAYRSKGRESIFWWWMDDERLGDKHGWAHDYYSYIIKEKGDPFKEENFWLSYKWHRRNSLWNLKRDKFLVQSTPAQVGNNNIEVVEIVTDKLVKLNSDGTVTKLNQDGIWVISPGLKYIPSDPSEDIWQVNQGDEISYKTSIVGEGMMWFKPTGKDQLMFRYGHCKIVKYGIFGITFWTGWRTFKAGYGNKSYVLTLKYQKIKPWS